MTVFEALSLMIAFGVLVAILSGDNLIKSTALEQRTRSIRGTLGHHP
ncbi:putative holin-like toxin [Numidum massiliense]